MAQNYYAIYILALAITGGSACLLVLFAVRHRTKAAGAGAFTALALAAAVYAFGYACELASTTLPAMLFWSKVEYLGIAAIPALWIIMAIQYIGKDRWLTRSVYAALFFIPLVTLFLHYTDNYWHLFYHATSVILQPFPHLLITRGPWYWVNLAYLYLSLIFGDILLINKFWRAAPSYYKQAWIILIGSLAPMISGIINLGDKDPWGLDLNPFTFILSGLLFAWGLFQYRLFDLVPVARDKVFEGMHDGVLVLDMQNRIVDFNASLQRIVPILTLKTIGQHARGALQDYPDLLQQIETNAYTQDELKLGTINDYRYFYSRLSPVVDNKQRLIGKTVVLNDVTKQMLLLERLQTLATIDDLTNIFNRRHLFALGNREIQLARRHSHPLSIILMDLDYFKQINDKYGHEAGDMALKIVAEICRQTLRTSDIFGRYGGEEFAAFLPETVPEVALYVAERLSSNIASACIPFNRAEIAITASFGVTGIEKAVNIDLNSLLRYADQALYQAKEAGRNQIMLVKIPIPNC